MSYECGNSKTCHYYHIVPSLSSSPLCRNSILWTPLDCAASKGHDKIVRLLVHHEAEVDPTDKSKITPLHLASREGHLSVVVTLLQFGADLKAMDHRGFNALDLAIENGHE